MPSSYRPQTPPPRLPSPDIAYMPLGPPPRRHLRPTQGDRLTARSCDSLSQKARSALSKTPSKSSLKPVREPSTPRSLPAPSPPPRSPGFRPTHRRSLSFAIPLPPPVPPIPAFALNPTDKKPVIRAPPSPIVTPIYLPDFDTISPIATTPSPRLIPQKRHVPAPSTIGMTCFKFFKSRNAHIPPRSACASVDRAELSEVSSSRIRRMKKQIGFFSLGLDCEEDDGNLVKSGCKMGT
ncbi:hypothetical protein IW261DRAFT_1434346 [Armillaria novae-zelandiae]|uniref:Uncharacterized protein n=1 Tax=Armillaria novae-zelandiae TaxID=153914 RepID=A0AA39PW46_9AGAR|nr:hypothetical protein IW261DRAFT_1434346 [Armillaria novae-zelandiae]